MLQETTETTMIFELWCEHKTSSCPQFKYLATVLVLELCMLVFVRSQREANFNMYIDAVTEISPWFFTLDHTNHTRWIPVHLSDMLNLTNKHSDVSIAFAKGMFTVQKTNHVYSCIAIDHAHKQSNALIKGDGGVVGITENPSALHRWMIAGPEVARLIIEFESRFPQKNAHLMYSMRLVRMCSLL